MTATAGAGSTATWNDCAGAGGTPAGNGTGTATCTFNNLDGNKTCTATFNLTANLPDLIVSQVDGPSSGARGGRISITYTVKNQGNVTARRTEIAFYLSTDTNITTKDIPLGKGQVPVLAPGASFTGTSWEYIRKDIPPGNYYIGAIVDPQNRIIESNEGNNTGYDSTLITISP